MQRREFLIFSSLLIAGCASETTKTAGPSGMGFSEAERQTITAHYAGLRAGRPAQEKPAQRAKPGDKLDSGQRPNKLPTELALKLKDLAAPYTRLTLGADVILVNRDTHDILDVVAQVAY